MEKRIVTLVATVVPKDSFVQPVKGSCSDEAKQDDESGDDSDEAYHNVEAG